MNAVEMSPEQALLNGRKYLENRRTIVLGISPGNPHYYKTETLEKLFSMADSKSDKVLLFIPDKIAEHNFRAIGSKKPEQSARKVNRLHNRINDVMRKMAFCEEKFSFIKWVEEVESCPAYIEAFMAIEDLYQRNDEFRFDVQESTKAALLSLKKGRDNGLFTARQDDLTTTFDVEEGAKYLLKELAFFNAVPKIYTNCEEFVYVYYRPWPVFEKYCSGWYDGIIRPSAGFVVFG